MACVQARIGISRTFVFLAHWPYSNEYTRQKESWNVFIRNLPSLQDAGYISHREWHSNFPANLLRANEQTNKKGKDDGYVMSKRKQISQRADRADRCLSKQGCTNRRKRDDQS